MELGCHRELDYLLLQVSTVAFEAAISEVHKLLCTGGVPNSLTLLSALTGSRPL